jgi:hypothetical protein
MGRPYLACGGGRRHASTRGDGNGRSRHPGYSLSRAPDAECRRADEASVDAHTPGSDGSVSAALSGSTIDADRDRYGAADGHSNASSHCHGYRDAGSDRDTYAGPYRYTNSDGSLYCHSQSVAKRDT